MLNPPTQYASDTNLRARQAMWDRSRREPDFELYPWVLDLAGIGGGESVLDVGCGNGVYERELAGRGHRGPVMALDLSAGMLTSNGHEVLVAGDVERLPFGDGAFDVVLAPHMLYHVPDRVAAAHELRRVLRGDGVCVAVTNGGDNHPELRTIIEAAVGEEWSLRRPSDVEFSLENGAEQLRAGFGSVERVDCPDRTVFVPDADLVAGYVASIADHYEDEVDRPWPEVVERARAAAAAAIATEGSLRISTKVGAFVCRDEVSRR